MSDCHHAFWRLDGACRDKDPELWFPERSNSSEANAAKAICKQQCTVRDRCLEWAIEQGVEFGVWGGTTYADRRRRGIKVKQGGIRELKGCGTSAAYDRHVKRKEPIDDDCREAHRQRQAEIRRRAKEKKAAAQAQSQPAGRDRAPALVGAA
jgi:hypothetical protein